MRLRILEEWNSFRKEVIPQDAPLVQIVEMRRAFYSGAQSLLCLQMRELTKDQEPTEADLRMMSEIEAELKAFAEDVKAGRA